MMSIIFDVGHPAHVHYCRILAKRLEQQGWSFLFTTKDKQIVIYLLEQYGLRYVSLGKHKKGSIGKIWSLFSYTLRLYLVAKKLKPDFFFNASPSAAFVSWIMGKVHIGLEDTFNMEQVRLYMPFTDVVLTSDYPHTPLGKKEIRYPGYHELAYLHPNVFSPDERILDCLGVKKGEKYAIVRFVAWNASHDVGQGGFSTANKITLVSMLSAKMKVFISSEGELPTSLQKYRLTISPEKIHDMMYYAHLFVGEGATMAEECSVLGTPSILVTSCQKGGIIFDLEKHNLMEFFSNSPDDQIAAINIAENIADNDTIKETMISRRQLLLRDKIDVTSFLVWFIEYYPDSIQQMKSTKFKFSRFK